MVVKQCGHQQHFSRVVRGLSSDSYVFIKSGHVFQTSDLHPDINSEAISGRFYTGELAELISTVLSGIIVHKPSQ